MAAFRRSGMLITLSGISIGFILAMLLLIASPDSLNPTTFYSLLLGWGLTAVLPLCIARSAIHITDAAERQRYHFELSLMAPPDRDLIYTYIGEALRRWNFWLALVIGLIPLLALASTQYKIQIDSVAYDDEKCLYTAPCAAPSVNSAETAEDAFTFAAAAVGLWGISALAAVLGVKMALSMGGRPILLVFIMTLAATAAVVMATVSQLQPFTVEVPTITLLRNNISMLLPYVVGLWLMRTSTGYARRGY